MTDTPAAVAQRRSALRELDEASAARTLVHWQVLNLLLIILVFVFVAFWVTIVPAFVPAFLFNALTCSSPSLQLGSALCAGSMSWAWSLLFTNGVMTWAILFK